MKVYQVWMEGFAFNEGRTRASYVGSTEAENFTEACIKLCSGRDTSRFGEFDPDRLSVFGCNLYPSEAEARKSFG